MAKKRKFATGSKPGPDEIDHYLESQGYYRKHVARDASSLFRVLAEFVAIVQNNHTKVRQEVANYMEKNRGKYAQEVDQNFYNYIAALRKPRTSGSLLELRVAANYYRKNVILFEPNQTHTKTNKRDYVTGHEDEFPMLIYYSHKDKHFDIIYTQKEVECLAENQSIVYQMLYSDVFKLPDVMYATERMLHDQKGETTVPLEDDETKYQTVDGEVYDFDKPENTNCVLKDPQTCHFHNRENFNEIVQKNKDAITIINRSDHPGRLKVFNPTEGYLYDEKTSCVRQLIDINITPFPYKVAKALDLCIYRNTEFEYWQETRKENRMRWHTVDKSFFASLPHPFAHAKTTASLRIEDDLEHDGDDLKKKYVYVTDDSEYCKKFDILSGYDHFRPSREAVEHIVMPFNVNYNNPNRHWRNHPRGPRQYYNRYQNNYNNHHEEREYQYAEPEPQVYSQQSQPVYQEQQYQYVPYADPNSPPTPSVYQPPQVVQYLQPAYQQQPIQYGNGPVTYNPPQPVAFPNFSVPPPPIYYPQSAVHVNGTNAASQEKDNGNGDQMNLIRESELQANNINWAPKESTDVNGNDFPDQATLQLFYNIGVRYYNAAGIQRRLESVASHLEALDIQQDDQQNLGDGLKHDQPPPVPANTPVTTKPTYNYGPPGNRSHHNNQYNNRRPFSHNQNYRDNQKEGNNNNNKGNRGYYNNNGRDSRDYGGRKEIQFNSNVKNVHKANQNGHNHNGNSHHNQMRNSAPRGGNQDKNNNNNNGIAQSQSSAVNGNSQNVSPTTDNSENSEQPQSQNVPFVLPNLSIPPPQLPQMTYSPQTPYYPPVQVQAYAPQQQYVNYQNENGEIVQVPQQVTYAQPVYYTAPSYPQTPVYYQQPPQFVEQSATSHDSGVDTVANGYAAQYVQPTYQQYYYQQPAPYYYPQTPIIQPAQPVYPVVGTTSNNVGEEENAVDAATGTEASYSPTNTEQSEEPAQA